MAAAIHLPWLIVGLAVVVSGTWEPTSDFAVIEARVRDVGTSHTPLVGAFSRAGFDHPGPLEFWVLAAPYRLVGPNGLLIGSLGVAYLAAVSATAMSLRRSRADGVATAAATLLLVLSTAADDGLVNPWNPWVAVLPFAAFLVSCREAGTGRARAWLAAVAWGSWCAQAHVGYLVLVPPLWVVTAALALVAHRHAGPDLRRAGGLVAATVALGVLLWSGPLLDQFSGEGNLGRIAEWSQQEDQDEEPLVGLEAALESVAYELRPVAPWSATAPSSGWALLVGSAPAVWLLVPLAALGFTAWAGWRSGDVALRPSAVIGLVAMATAVIGVSRIRGLAAYYLVLWHRPIAAFIYAAAAVAVWRTVRPAMPAALTPRRRQALAVGLGVGVSVPTLWAVAGATPPFAREGTALADAAAELRAELDPDEPVVITATGQAYLLIGPGLVLDLDRHGYEAYELDPAENDLLEHARALLGAHRTRPSDGARVLVVVAGRDDVDLVRQSGRNTVLAEGNVLSDQEVAEMERLTAAISPAAVYVVAATDDRLERRGPDPALAGATWEEVNRLIELRQRDHPVMVAEVR